jgi:hypothetical protein
VLDWFHRCKSWTTLEAALVEARYEQLLGTILATRNVEPVCNMVVTRDSFVSSGSGEDCYQVTSHSVGSSVDASQKNADPKTDFPRRY